MAQTTTALPGLAGGPFVVSVMLPAAERADHVPRGTEFRLVAAAAGIASRGSARIAARIAAGRAASAVQALVEPLVNARQQPRAAARITARIAARVAARIAGVGARITAIRGGLAGRLARIASVRTRITARIAAVAAATKTLQQPAGAGVTSVGQTEQGGNRHHRKQNSRLHGKSPVGEERLAGCGIGQRSALALELPVVSANMGKPVNPGKGVAIKRSAPSVTTGKRWLIAVTQPRACAAKSAHSAWRIPRHRYGSYWPRCLSESRERREFAGPRINASRCKRSASRKLRSLAVSWPRLFLGEVQRYANGAALTFPWPDHV